MQRTRIKFCGITRLADALLASALGVDALGFIFYPPSPRYISPEKAADIVAQLPPIVTTVGVFVDAEAEIIKKTLAAVPLSLLQFHGDEVEADCDCWSKPYIKTIKVRPQGDLTAETVRHKRACGLLMDTHLPDQAGGTGKVFDWSALPKTSQPVLLAGGLTPNNVASAIAQVSPYAVDVSTGIEQSPGIKDEGLMRSFAQAVHHA